jgi:hypothetical protein
MSRVSQSYSSSSQVEVIPSYLALALLGVFFCLPLSVVAMFQAARVNSLRASGDLAGARKASARAKGWAVGSLGVGIILYLIGCIVTLIAVSVSANSK